MIRKRTKLALDQIRPDETGAYRYVGGHYLWDGAESERKAALTKLWMICAGTVLVTLLAGFISAPGAADAFYVVIPYVGALLLSLWSAWILGTITAAKERIRDYQYDSTVKRLPDVMRASGCFALITMAGEIAYLILHGSQGKMLWMGLYMAAMGISGVLALLGARMAVRSMTWKIHVLDQKPQSHSAPQEK